MLTEVLSAGFLTLRMKHTPHASGVYCRKACCNSSGTGSSTEHVVLRRALAEHLLLEKAS